VLALVFASAWRGNCPVVRQQLAVKTYTTVDGLPRNRVECIVEDPRGFLWFCAGGLLSRFDGYTFTNYDAKQGLPHRYVTSIQITGPGVYWVGTMSGLFRLDAHSSPPQRFELVRVGGNENSGFVAKNSRMRDRGPSDEIAASDGQPKQLFDKLQLREWVTFAHPFGSPLPNHVDRLDSL